MSDRMPEDLPVTKLVDVMVGITRSKVICWYLDVSIWLVISGDDVLFVADLTWQPTGFRRGTRWGPFGCLPLLWSLLLSPGFDARL